MATAYTIGALGRDTGVGIETIRYYERIGLMRPPLRSEAGYRHYQAADTARLRFIKRGRELGFGIEEIRALLHLAEQPDTSCSEADRLVREHLEQVEKRIEDLSRLKGVLESLAGCEHGLARDCRIIEALSGDSVSR